MTRGRRTAALLAGLLAVSVTGCGDRTESYCAELEDRRAALADLAGRADEPGNDVLGDTLEVWRELREEAPRDITDEWSTVVFALEGLVDAFEQSGTTPGEYDPASPPAGVSEAEARRLEDAAAQLATPRVVRAGEGLEQHARDVCKVDLGLGAGEG